MKLLAILILAVVFLAPASPVFALTPHPENWLRHQPPVIIQLEPVEAQQDETFSLYVYGVNFQKKTTLEFQPAEGIEAKGIKVPLGGNQLSAKIYIKEDAPLGPRDLIVINPNGLSDVLTKAFTVLRGRPKEKPKVQLIEINFNPSWQDAGREWIKIKNFSQTSYSLKDWIISDQSGKTAAKLPDWQILPETILIIYFAQGINDSDFSDGSAKFYTGQSQEIFSNKMDEVALYAGQPSSDFIIDFLSWSKTYYQPGKAYSYALGAGIWEKDKFLDISNFKEGETIKREEIEKFIGQAPIIRAKHLTSIYNSYIKKIPRSIRWLLGSGLARVECVFADGYQMPLAVQIERGEIIKVEPWVDDDGDDIPNVWERAEFLKVNFNLYINEKDLKELSEAEDWKSAFEKVWPSQIKYRAVRANDKVKLVIFNVGLKVYSFFRKIVLFVKSKFGR